MRTSLVGIAQAAVLTLCMVSCSTGESTEDRTEGSLFIIGGGSRPPSLVSDMISLAGLEPSDYIVIFPHASSYPDTALFYSGRQFAALGYHRIVSAFRDSGRVVPASLVDSVRRAKLIYLSGGDQAKFMERVTGTPLYEAMRSAYEEGAMIAGTSAGAAVMSARMITGEQKKYPEYSGYFRTIEAHNMELARGMGFLDSVVIDQHFVRRMRLNRLLAVVLEHPGLTGIGIDESTALYVRGDTARVYGESQVVVVRHPGGTTSRLGDLMGARGMDLDILIPGDTLCLR